MMPEQSHILFRNIYARISFLLLQCTETDRIQDHLSHRAVSWLEKNSSYSRIIKQLTGKKKYWPVKNGGGTLLSILRLFLYFGRVLAQLILTHDVLNNFNRMKYEVSDKKISPNSRTRSVPICCAFFPFLHRAPVEPKNTPF